MAQDPAFLFYPGDYLRDTQCLSENVQVAYDRIMCEHMRNICISQSQLKFFTKKLNESEIEELKNVLTEENGNYMIKWVAESINKRRDYSDSRRKNRAKKTKEDMCNISKTYDEHMENEIENVNKDINTNKIIYPFDSDTFKEKWKLWNAYRKEKGCQYKTETSEQMALKKLSEFDEQFAIELIETSISNQWQGLIFAKTKQEYNDRKNGNSKAKFGTKPSLSDVEAEINRLYPDAAK